MNAGQVTLLCRTMRVDNCSRFELKVFALVSYDAPGWKFPLRCAFWRTHRKLGIARFENRFLAHGCHRWQTSLYRQGKGKTLPMTAPAVTSFRTPMTYLKESSPSTSTLSRFVVTLMYSIRAIMLSRACRCTCCGESQQASLSTRRRSCMAMEWNKRRGHYLLLWLTVVSEILEVHTTDCPWHRR